MGIEEVDRGLFIEGIEEKEIKKRLFMGFRLVIE
jgi:hypothetical protein